MSWWDIIIGNVLMWSFGAATGVFILYGDDLLEAGRYGLRQILFLAAVLCVSLALFRVIFAPMFSWL